MKVCGSISVNCSLVPRKTHSHQLRAMGFVLETLELVLDLGTQVGNCVSPSMLLSFMVDLSFSCSLRGLCYLAYPFFSLAWLILCLRDLVQILKETASLIWLIIISPLGREPCRSLARLRDEYGAHPVCSVTICLAQESLRDAFLKASIIIGCWVWQAPCLTSCDSKCDSTPLPVHRESFFLGNKGTIS